MAFYPALEGDSRQVVLFSKCVVFNVDGSVKGSDGLLTLVNICLRGLFVLQFLMQSFTEVSAAGERLLFLHRLGGNNA